MSFHPPTVRTRGILSLFVLGALALWGCDAAPESGDPDSVRTAGLAAAPPGGEMEPGEALALEDGVARVYKSPACGCCAAWVDHLREAGFDVRVEDRANVTDVKVALGVPAHVSSCHTAVVDGFVVEGHVPATTIRRLLAERPPVVGLAVPGMPMGSPGMEGVREDPYDVLTFDGAGATRVFESRP